MNICLVSVEFPPPDKKIDIITSSNDVRNANKEEIIIENFICGKVIKKNALILDVPWNSGKHYGKGWEAMVLNEAILTIRPIWFWNIKQFMI